MININYIVDFIYNFRLFIIIFNPLIVFIVLTLFGRKLGTKGCWYLIVFSGLIQIISFIYFFFFDFFINFNNNSIIILHLGNWFKIGNIKVNFTFIFDSLSVIMMQLVIIISFITQVYSFFYLSREPNLIRFQSYISLFTFFMLILVSSDNFILFFTGWEGVGLCSYLLISFWSTRPDARLAGLKAVAVNRIGDCAFIIAIALIMNITKSIEFSVIFNTVGYYNNIYISFFTWNVKYFNIVNFFILIAVMAKSAQIGLHIWLADAMEGPTPVSALIHAATMVTAGVYLVIRVSFLFELTPDIKVIMSYVGAMTAFFGASTASFQWDIKKIIAYSTCSQLGYMVCVCGFGGYNLGFYHLVTHGYFKALLFFSAGLIIHNFNGEQDIRRMGGLFNYFPITFGYFIVGLSSLIGFPGATGYYSKEKILDYISVIPGENGIVCYNLLIGALVFTVVYSIRLLVYVFFGKTRGPRPYYVALDNNSNNILEAPYYIIFVLTILVFFSVFGDIVFHNFTIGVGSNFMSSSIIDCNSNKFMLIAEGYASTNRQIPVIAIIIGIVMYFFSEYVFNKYRKFYFFIQPAFNNFIIYNNNSYYIRFIQKIVINFFSNFFKYFFIFFQKGWLIDYSVGEVFFPIFKFFINASFIIEKGLCEYIGPYGINIIFTTVAQWIAIFNVVKPAVFAISAIPIINFAILVFCILLVFF